MDLFKELKSQIDEQWTDFIKWNVIESYIASRKLDSFYYQVQRLTKYNHVVSTAIKVNQIKILLTTSNIKSLRKLASSNSRLNIKTANPFTNWTCRHWKISIW